jgi:hypothetical protein
MGGSCGGRCNPGFDDCNRDFRSDGCEINLASDPANCGACGSVCPQGASCSNGLCQGGGGPGQTGAPCMLGSDCKSGVCLNFVCK